MIMYALNVCENLIYRYLNEYNGDSAKGKKTILIKEYEFLNK